MNYQNNDSVIHKNFQAFILSNDKTEIEKNLPQIAESFGLFGSSDSILDIARTICIIAPSDVPVLITGESGSGKDVVARALHQLSLRRSKPLVIVNSGAIAEGILESELFGHEKGAFTGAVSERKGYFETADGGTIFLDEIGDTPLTTQVKLLRVLESGEFLKVGGSHVKKSDVRVIAATHRNLEQMVRRGEFRKDLYYRLKAITVTVPPLRSRREDIPIIVRKFVDEFSLQTKAAFKGFSAEALQLMKEYHWPGNVRELRNFVESLMAIRRGELITAEDVEKHLLNYKDLDQFELDRNDTLPVATHMSPEQAEREFFYRTLITLKRDVDDVKNFLITKFGAIPRAVDSQFPNSLPSDKKVTDGRIVETDYNIQDSGDTVSLVEKEKELIIKALRRSKGRRNVAAKELGLSERTLYRKIKEYNLDL